MKATNISKIAYVASAFALAVTSSFAWYDDPWENGGGMGGGGGSGGGGGWSPAVGQFYASPGYASLPPVEVTGSKPIEFDITVFIWDQYLTELRVSRGTKPVPTEEQQKKLEDEAKTKEDRKKACTTNCSTTQSLEGALCDQTAGEMWAAVYGAAGAVRLLSRINRPKFPDWSGEIIEYGGAAASAYGTTCRALSSSRFLACTADCNKP